LFEDTLILAINASKLASTILALHLKLRMSLSLCLLLVKELSQIKGARKTSWRLCAPRFEKPTKGSGYEAIRTFGALYSLDKVYDALILRLQKMQLPPWSLAVFRG
jgi:hypothetical protein